MPPRQLESSPGDFRRALTDRLRALAKDGRWTVPQLQRQISYDRLLARLYHVDDGWIVKGAALLARDIGCRGTIDIDVYRAKSSEAAERDLRAAAETTSATGFASRSGRQRPWPMTLPVSACSSRHTSGRRNGSPSGSISWAPTSV